MTNKYQHKLVTKYNGFIYISNAWHYDLSYGLSIYLLTKKTLYIVHKKYRKNVVLCKIKFYFRLINYRILTLLQSLRPNSVLHRESKSLLNITSHIHLYQNSRLNLRLYLPQEYIQMGVWTARFIILRKFCPSTTLN